MKIYYEPYRGFNNSYDFAIEDSSVMKFSFTEPEEPRLIREIGVDYIVNEITKRYGFSYSFRLLLMKQLLPEQIRVLWSHAYRIYSHTSSKIQFIPRFRSEVEQIAKQEIEPGMFKDEDTL
ncbi:MAG: hypothetical protein ACXACY_23580 [Candidatus Hodarchaeales archaeon]|jgi:hypothetical protein